MDKQEEIKYTIEDLAYSSFYFPLIWHIIVVVYNEIAISVKNEVIVPIYFVKRESKKIFEPELIEKYEKTLEWLIYKRAIEKYEWIEETDSKTKVGVNVQVNKSKFLTFLLNEWPKIDQFLNEFLKSQKEISDNKKEGSSKRIRYNENEGKFEIIQKKKVIDSFSLSGYNESILKVLVNSNKPLEKKEIIKLIGITNEVKEERLRHNFTEYKNRLNRELNKYGFEIICEKNKYFIKPKKPLFY